MITPHFLAPDYAVSKQLKPADLGDVKGMGFRVIVNNRPDNEVLPMWNGPAIEAAARAHGLLYRALPVGGEVSRALVEQLARIIAAGGPILAYCSSGGRSAALWGLAAALAGGAPDAIRRAAAKEGYDLGPALPLMEEFALSAVATDGPPQERGG